jgi:hypothetical protein
MHIVVLIVLCFFTAWLIAYLDHGVKFLEFLFDFENLLVGMVMSAFVLFFVYVMLKLAYRILKFAFGE